MSVTHLTSVTRLVDLDRHALEVQPVERARWGTGDYVVGRVAPGAVRPHQVELPTGRLIDVLPGDRVVGALGDRAATLQIVGGWDAIGDDGVMDALSMGGVIGRATSTSAFARPVIPLHYEGHVHRDGRPASMSDFVTDVRPDFDSYTVPTVLIIGSSMDAGKTLTGRQIIRSFERRGLRPAAAKLTGVGRYRDVLALGDAGARPIIDFVDVGLPSTVVPVDAYRSALRTLLARVQDAAPDVLVAEAGASPLEPYNGDLAVAELAAAARCTVLCASDPYAVIGVMEAFGHTPDFVAGRAVSTSAGRELVERLTGLLALNVADPDCEPELDEVLRRTVA